jgi:hypothetical protein
MALLALAKGLLCGLCKSYTGYNTKVSGFGSAETGVLLGLQNSTVH